jgi:hypothetical protein
VFCRGALVVAKQRIYVGIVHAGRTLNVEAADTTWRIYDGGRRRPDSRGRPHHHQTPSPDSRVGVT